MKNAEMQPKGYGTTAKAPAGAVASDKSGQRMERKTDGVAMGKADKTGSDSKYGGGQSKGMCYEHVRKSGQD